MRAAAAADSDAHPGQPSGGLAEVLVATLVEVRDGRLDVSAALERLRGFPVDASVESVRIDTQRELRTGVAEVVLCEGKSAQQVAAILGRLRDHHGRALGTRATPELAREVRERLPEAGYDPVSRLLTLPAAVGLEAAGATAQSAERTGQGAERTGQGAERTGQGAERCGQSAGVADLAGGGDGSGERRVGKTFGVDDDDAAAENVAGGAVGVGEDVEVGAESAGHASPVTAVVSGGTADLPVAEEAAQTLEFLGCPVERLYDVGVAGVHRLLAVRPQLARAAVVISVAGMEGALTSVVAGLVAAPVIGVPTSVGYGANLGGAAALLAMLNSCASGVAVVNIDNGFGAALMAHAIVRGIQAAARGSGWPASTTPSALR